jgi:hypothetical protein
MQKVGHSIFAELAHLDSTQLSESAGQIEQDFIGAGPTDQGQPGGTA